MLLSTPINTSNSTPNHLLISPTTSMLPSPVPYLDLGINWASVNPSFLHPNTTFYSTPTVHNPPRQGKGKLTLHCWILLHWDWSLFQHWITLWKLCVSGEWDDLPIDSMWRIIWVHGGGRNHRVQGVGISTGYIVVLWSVLPLLLSRGSSSY